VGWFTAKVIKKKERKKGKKEGTLKPCSARNTVVYGFFWPVIFMKLKSHSGVLLRKGTAFKSVCTV
jgi:hypothetical protein